MADFSIYINRRFVKKNGDCAIYVRLVIKGKQIMLNTGVSVNPDTNWDKERNLILGKSQQVKDDNLLIKNCIKRVTDILVKYRLRNRELTPDLFMHEYNNPSIDIDFYAFYASELKKEEGTYANDTYRLHNSVLSKLKIYRKELSFSELTTDFLKGYQKYLRKDLDNNANTIRKNLKIIKIYVNRALRNDLIEKDPFVGIEMKKGSTDIIYLEPKELDSLIVKYKKNELSPNLHRVARYYLFSCFTGLRISDIKTITHDNIVNNTLVFTPKKTKELQKIIKVKLTIPAFELIKDTKNNKGVIFNTYSDPVTNRYLKEIAKDCKINKQIKFHSARHTFATMFYRMTKDIVGLKTLLGHSDIKHTMVYTHIVSSDIDAEMDSFNKLWG